MDIIGTLTNEIIARNDQFCDKVMKNIMKNGYAFVMQKGQQLTVLDLENIYRDRWAE